MVLILEAVKTSETSVNMYETTLRNISHYGHLRVNLKSHKHEYNKEFKKQTYVDVL